MKRQAVTVGLWLLLSAQQMLVAQEWQLLRSTDPFVDFELVTASLQSEFKGDLARLIANCLDGENPTLWVQFTSRTVDFSKEKGDFGGGQNEIMWRFGTEKPETGKWHSVSDGVLVVPRPGRFMLKLTQHQKFVIRAQSLKSGEVTAVFNTSRSGPVIDEVLRDCPNAPKRKNE